MRWPDKAKKKIARLWSQTQTALTGKAAGSATAWDPQRTLLALRFLAVGLLIVAPFVGWGFAEGRLSGYVSAQAKHAPTAASVCLCDVPAWVPAGHQALLRQAAAQQLSRDPLDRRDLERAEQTIAQSPWVEAVDRVERSGDRVTVAAQYRRPAALVRSGDGYRLIDTRGVLLPGWYRPERLPIIEGVTAAPPHEGATWPGAPIQAGLGIVRVAAGKSWASQVKAYGVGQTDSFGRIRIVLWTGPGRDLARDPHVVWGLPPGQEGAVEPSVPSKLARLAAIQNDPQYHGWIDAEHRIVEVYGATVFQLAPLPAAGDPSPGTRYTLMR
jgi:hypothetical protein